MSSQTKECLSGDFIVTIGRNIFQPAAATGPGKTTERQGKAIDNRDVGIELDHRKQIMPKHFFDLPEIGSLPHKRSSMDIVEPREPVTIMFSEEPEDHLVLIKTKKLANDLAMISIVSTSLSLNV